MIGLSAFALCLALAMPLVETCRVCGSHFNEETYQERWRKTCDENRDQLLPPSHYLDQMANQTCEVWVLDQAYDDDKQRENGGGMLYIYDSAKLKSNRGQGAVETINMTNATIIANGPLEGACRRGQKPHMISSYPYFTHMNYALISYVGSGDIQETSGTDDSSQTVMNIKTREIIGCYNTRSKGGSPQNHYAEFTSDGKFIVVLDIGGPAGLSGHLHKIRVEKKPGEKLYLELTHEKTLKLQNCIEDLATRAARPICGGFERRNGLFYVTMSHGGLLIADAEGEEFKVVKVYSHPIVKGDGCGGSRRYSGNFGMVTNGASTGKSNLGDYLYFHNTTAPCHGKFPNPIELEIPKWKPNAKLSYDNTPYGNVPLGDSHGTGMCVVKETGEEILLSTVRLSNEIVFVNTSTQQIFERLSLVRREFLPNPTPDLITLAAYGGEVMCMSLRGGVPLSAIGKFRDKFRRTPGMLCVHMADDCRSFTFDEKDFYPTTEQLYPTPDPHAIFQVCYEKEASLE